MSETIVPANEAAIITKNRERLELVFPNMAEDEPVPTLFLALTACFIRLEKDRDFVEEQLRYIGANRPSPKAEERQ